MGELTRPPASLVCVPTRRSRHRAGVLVELTRRPSIWSAYRRADEGSQEHILSTAGSLGRPRTRSPMMLRWISLVPPAMPSIGANRYAAAGSPPATSCSSHARLPAPAIAMPRLAACLPRTVAASLATEPSGPGARPDTSASRIRMPSSVEDAFEDVHLDQLLAHDRVVGASASAGEPEDAPVPVAAERLRAAAGADGDPLVGEHVERDPPAVVDCADQRVGGQPDVVEEHLVEVGAAVDLTQRTRRDARRTHVDDEHADARGAWARRGRCARRGARSRRGAPPEVHTFCPFTTHSSPSRSARVCRLATSEPAPGSEKS